MWKRWLWRSLGALLVAAAAIAGAGWYAWHSLALDQTPAVADAPVPALLMSEPLQGRILAVVSSAPTQAHNGRPAGYELTELARAYALFQQHG